MTAKWSRASSRSVMREASVGQTSGVTQRCLNPRFSLRIGISRRTGVRQRESRRSKQRDGEPKEYRELSHAPWQLEHFLLEFGCLRVRHVQADHDLRCLAKSPTRRRARDAQIRGDGDVPGALDEIPKSMVVPLLTPCRGGHGDDHRPFLTHGSNRPRDGRSAVRRCQTIRRCDENSSLNVQNVRGHSSALRDDALEHKLPDLALDAIGRPRQRL
jgi:hypothetical protein